MSETKTPFGQTDVVYFRDEDAAARLVDDAVGGLWEVVNQLTRFRSRSSVPRDSGPARRSTKP